MWERIIFTSSLHTTEVREMERQLDGMTIAVLEDWNDLLHLLIPSECLNSQQITSFETLLVLFIILELILSILADIKIFTFFISLAMPSGKIEKPSMNQQLESGNAGILIRSSTVKTDL